MNSEFEKNLKEERGFIEKKNQFVKDNYIFIAIGLTVFAGMLTFAYEIISAIALENDLSSISLYFPMFIGGVVFWPMYHTKEAIYNKVKFGHYWSVERSCYLKYEGDEPTGGDGAPLLQF